MSPHHKSRTCRRSWRNPCLPDLSRKSMSGPSQAPGRYKAFRPSSAHGPSSSAMSLIDFRSDGGSEKANVNTVQNVHLTSSLSTTPRTFEANTLTTPIELSPEAQENAKPGVRTKPPVP